MVKPTNSVSEPESEIIKKIAAEKEYAFVSAGRFGRQYIERCGGGS